MRWLPALPVLLLLAVFAVSNRQSVALGLWPTDYSLQLPLSLAVLIAAALGFLIGAVVVWAESLSQRLRARRAEQRVRVLEAENVALRASRSQAVLPALDA